MHHSLITSILIIATSAASAQEVLTVDAAVNLALERSPAVQAARSAAEAADARHRKARGFRLPTVDLSETYSRTDNPAEAFAMTLNQKRFDFDDFLVSDPNNPDALNTWITRLEVVQPVYTGGELSARIGQAELMATAENLTWRHVREQVAFDTMTAFTNTAKAREYLELLKQARKTTSEHVDLADRYAAQGLIVKAELLKAQVELAKMDEMVANAIRDAKLAEAALNFHMGLDQNLTHRLAQLPPPHPITNEIGTWLESGLEKRADLQAAQQRLDVGRLEEKAVRSGFLPEVAVIGRYDLYDDSPFGSNGDSASVVAVATINLFRGGSDAAGLEAARFDTSSGKYRIKRFEEGIRLEIQQAWRDLQTARQRHATAHTAVEAAREALRVREHRFKQGLDKMIDLLDAETALRESEVRELVARYDLTLAGQRLHYASGTPLTTPASLTENS